MKYRKAAIMESFVPAYQWQFGGSKKAARDVYKQASPEYIKQVIVAYDNETRKAFYND